MAYVEQFGLETAPFTMDNPRALALFDGRLFRLGEIEANPDALPFDLAPEERGIGPAELYARALRPLLEQLATGGGEAWATVLTKYDGFSVREYFEAMGWSEGAIERFGLLFNQEAMMNSSFIELLREEAGQFYTDLVRIEGGTDRLPAALAAGLRDRIRYGARVTAIDQSPEGVSVHCQGAGGAFTVEGDYAIVTLPLPVLRHVEALKPFSRPKQRAIRQLHYDAAAKVFLQFRRRFWEEDDGIAGGGSVTDLAIRNVYYPEHGRETGRGVLLASYTWGDDAQRWGSLPPGERLVQALENVARLHPQAPGLYECGASKMWHDDEFAGGAYALFDPGQQTLLHQHIVAPEGRLHFAGEHASLYHAWIQGAIQSGLRAAAEVHEAARAAS
jgi:monoamine oxidase